MDLQQTKILLEKMNALFKSISMNAGSIAPIERDLMLSYIRQLYESLLSPEELPSPTPRMPATEMPTPSKAGEKPKEKEKKYTPPKIIEIPDSLKEVSDPVQPLQPKEKPDREMVFSPQPAARSKERPNVDILFEHRKSQELSEKLSERPVEDLGKAMAINDRLLYLNELFGKDQRAFQDTLQLLNKFESMEEAKSLLSNLAEQYNWIEDEKQETARNFIKLVRRRYTR